MRQWYNRSKNFVGICDHGKGNEGTCMQACHIQCSDGAAGRSWCCWCLAADRMPSNNTLDSATASKLRFIFAMYSTHQVDAAKVNSRVVTCEVTQPEPARRWDSPGQSFPFQLTGVETLRESFSEWVESIP